jgi:hypothetical protein
MYQETTSVGDTVFTSDNELFSSTDKRSVQEFEQSGIKSKFDLTASIARYWQFRGDCPIAEEFYKDWCRCWSLAQEMVERWQTSLPPHRRSRFRSDEVMNRKFTHVFKRLGYSVKNI